MKKNKRPRGSSPSSTRPSKGPEPPPFLTPKGDEILLMLKVRPGAPSSGWEEVLGDRLKVRVTGPPQGGKANASLIDFVADALKCPKRDLTLIRGHKSRDKTLSLTGKARDRAPAYFAEMTQGPP